MILFLYFTLSISFFAPIYTYALYPLILVIMSIYKKRNYKIDGTSRPFVSVLIAAYNEEKIIGEKMQNLSQLDYPSDRIEYLIDSDGSSDRTVEIAKCYSYMNNLRVFDLPRRGKVNALNTILRLARGDLLVFSDANTIYDSKAILNLVKYFSDDRIGCVSGQLRYKIDASSGNGAKAENTYWKYENWIKGLESSLGQLSGANGAIYAVRKEIISEIPKGIINDDFYVATFAMQSGYDVILEKASIAYEKPNDDYSSQFKRHIRDGAGHYQAIFVFWRMLFPRKGSFVYFSHRLIRWLVPFFLISAFISNAVLVNHNLIAAALFGFQLLGYSLMIAYYYGFANSSETNSPNNNMFCKLIKLPFYFFSVNLALLLGFYKWALGQQKAVWETQR